MIRSLRLGFGAALLLALAAGPVARAAEPDKLLPADSDTVISINVKQIMDSDIVKKYAVEQMKQALQGADIKKFMDDLGLDPLKDIEKVVIGGSWTDQNDIKGLVIIRGTFDPDKLYRAAEAQTKKDADHFSMIKDGNDVIFKYQPDNGNPVYGTVVDKTTVILGTEKKYVTTATATAAAPPKKVELGKDIAVMINRMDDKASVWVAAVVKDKLDKLPIPMGGGIPNLQGQLGKMDAVTAVLQVNKDIDLTVNLGMKDDGSADEMGKTVDELLQTVKGALPFLAAQNEQLKPLVDVVKTLKCEVRAKTVTITGKVTGAAIGKMINPGDGQ